MTNICAFLTNNSCWEMITTQKQPGVVAAMKTNVKWYLRIRHATCRQAAASVLALALIAAPAQSDIFQAGPELTASYSFSDELGGFQIIALSGLGTLSDPVRISGDLLRTTPVMLTIRATRPINPFQRPDTHSTGTIHFVFDVANGSGQPWIGFEFELREEPANSQPLW